jgi:hypothetical protein
MTHTHCQLFTSVVWFFLLERTSDPGFDQKKKLIGKWLWVCIWSQFIKFLNWFFNFIFGNFFQQIQEPSIRVQKGGLIPCAH